MIKYNNEIYYFYTRFRCIDFQVFSLYNLRFYLDEICFII